MNFIGGDGVFSRLRAPKLLEFETGIRIGLRGAKRIRQRVAMVASAQ